MSYPFILLMKRFCDSSDGSFICLEHMMKIDRLVIWTNRGVPFIHEFKAIHTIFNHSLRINDIISLINFITFKLTLFRPIV